MCSTSQFILYYLFNSLYRWAVVQWPPFFITLCCSIPHIISTLYSDLQKSCIWLLLLVGYCWTSVLFIGELSYLRTGRLMLEIWAWGKPTCNPCCCSLKSCIVIPRTGNTATLKCSKLKIYTLSIAPNKNTMFSRYILTKIFYDSGKKKAFYGEQEHLHLYWIA